MGRTLGELHLPMLVVQEGGYNATMTGEVLAQACNTRKGRRLALTA